MGRVDRMYAHFVFRLKASRFARFACFPAPPLTEPNQDARSARAHPVYPAILFIGVLVFARLAYLYL